MSELGDIADRAAAREAEFLSDALAEQRRRTHSSLPSLEICEECGAGIPPARRLAVPGVRLCVACQTAAEKLGARYAV